jgi:hypothetical protein
MQAGMYSYRLVADGKVIGVKRMVVTKQALIPMH